MKIKEEQFKKIEQLMPLPRGSVTMSHLAFLNALLYVIENGCKWRALPESLGKWDTVYRRANRWAKNGLLDKVFLGLQSEQIIRLKIEHVSLDSTNIKVHPDAHGALKKRENSVSAKAEGVGIPSFMWLPRMTKLP